MALTPRKSSPMPTKWRALLSRNSTPRFQIELNGLRPPTGFGASREQLLGQMGHDTFSNFYRRQSRRCLRKDLQESAFHGFVHVRVDVPDGTRVVHILDPDLVSVFSWTRHRLLLGLLILSHRAAYSWTAHAQLVRFDLIDRRAGHNNVREIVVVKMHQHAFYVVDLEGATDALRLLAGPHHEVLDKELAAAVEKVCERDLTLWRVEDVLLLDADPGELAPLATDLVALSRIGLSMFLTLDGFISGPDGELD
jgi:hypothetical protein